MFTKLVACEQTFSKLPIRQLISIRPTEALDQVSKLPIRQLMFACLSTMIIALSKLPIRQLMGGV